MDGDYYVQAEVSTGGFAIELSLNEYDSYYLQPEPVRVYEATNDAALALADLIGPAGHRESLSRSEFEAPGAPGEVRWRDLHRTNLAGQRALRWVNPRRSVSC